MSGDDPFAGLFGLPSTNVGSPTLADNSLMPLSPTAGTTPSAVPNPQLFDISMFSSANETSPQRTTPEPNDTQQTLPTEIDDPFAVFSSPSPSPASTPTSSFTAIDPFSDLFSATAPQTPPQVQVESKSPQVPKSPATNTQGFSDSTKPEISQEFPSDAINDTEEADIDGDEEEIVVEENEDMFEQAYDIAKALEQKLKENQSYSIVETEMQQLLSVLKNLESQVQERDEDARKLLQVFQSARDKGPAPTPVPLVPTNQFSAEDISKIVKMQRLWRKTRGNAKGRLSDVVLYYRARPDEDARQRIRWHKIVKVLIHTEQVYVRKLYLLVNCFMSPLEKKIKLAKQKMATTNSTSILPSGLNTLMNSVNECKIATPKQFGEIFMNAKLLFVFHESFLKNLRQAYYCWPRKPLILSQLFQLLIPYMQAYVTYFSNYQTHLNTIMQLQKYNRHFVNWVHSVQRNHFELNSKNGALHIPDLSIAPIQRIFRYESIVEALIACGSPNRSDLEPLKQFLTQLKKLTDHVQSFKTVNENMKSVFNAQMCIIGNDVPVLMDPHRFFIRDGDILILTDRIHRRHLYIFSDVLILTKKSWKPGSEEQVFQKLIPLEDAVVVDDMEVPFSFRIRYEKGRSFMSFVCNSDEEKALWMRDITNASAGSVKHLKPSQPDQLRKETVQPNRTLSKQGYLSKMEGGFIKTWKTRWIQIASGILHSYASESDSVPLRSYHLREYTIKQMYVTDNFTRYCVHMIQYNGKRQIILSTYSKDILEEWLVVLKESVDLQNSLAFGGRDASVIVEPPPVVVTSSEESEKSFTPSTRARFFPEEVSNEFVAAANDRKAFRMLYFDESGNRLQVEQLPKHTTSPTSPKPSTPDVKPPVEQPPAPNVNTNPKPSLLPFGESAESIAPPSPYNIKASSTKEQGIDFSAVKRQENRSSSSLDQNASYQLPQAIVAFQAKFNLPVSERPVQYFPLASGCIIYLTKRLVCVESLFQGNQAVLYSDIAKLHKSKPGILGKGTGGRIELTNGSMIELSGMIKRKDTYHAIVSQAKQLKIDIPVYRDGFGKEG